RMGFYRTDCLGNGQRVEVSNKQEVLELVLILRPQANRTDIVTDVKPPRRGNSAEDPLSARRCHCSPLSNTRPSLFASISSSPRAAAIASSDAPWARVSLR